MYAALPRSEYYDGAAPPAPSAGVAPIPAPAPPDVGWTWNARRWFPRSLLPDQRVRHPALPLRHRQRLRRRPSPWPPDPSETDPAWSSPAHWQRAGHAPRTSPNPPGFRAGIRSRGVTKPVSHVYLPVSLTAPAPSGSTGTTRLCRGCSRPPRRPAAQAASSFTPPLRRQGDGRSFTSTRTNSASWRTFLAYTFPSRSPRPAHPAVLNRRGFVEAAPALPGDPRIRLPPASPRRRDGGEMDGLSPPSVNDSASWRTQAPIRSRGQQGKGGSGAAGRSGQGQHGAAADMRARPLRKL